MHANGDILIAMPLELFVEISAPINRHDKNTKQSIEGSNYW